MTDIQWRRVNDEPFEYAIQQGRVGDEFVKLLDGSCLRRPIESRHSLRLWGWFDEAGQEKPSYDPPHDAPCPYCLVPISEDDVRTHSLMMAGPHYAKRSYFYRTHATCDDTQSDTGMDGKIFDAIAKSGD